MQDEDFEESSLNEDRPIFRCLRFFKKLEQHVRILKENTQLSSVKEIEFLKGRLREVENCKDER